MKTPKAPIKFPLHPVQQAARALIAKHDSVRKAAHQIDLDHAYLHRLAYADTRPTAETLKKLGLSLRVEYRAEK